MINNLKFLLLCIIMLVPLGCYEDSKATVDVIKKRINNHIQNLVGKGDIAVQKYENKINEVRDNLIKVKVSQKTFERKVEAKKVSLASLENSGGSPEKIAILKNTIHEMEVFLQQIQVAETKLGNTLKKLINNLDVVKLKVAHLEAKRDMLDAMRTIQEYTNMEGDIDGIGGNIESTIGAMQQEIDEIEAAIEVENLLTQVDELG